MRVRSLGACAQSFGAVRRYKRAGLLPLPESISISPPAPYAAVEIFVDANGLRSTRYSAGVRRTIGEFIVDFSYFFEDRRPTPAGERHMFSTSFHWRNMTRRVDPDF